MKKDLTYFQNEIKEGFDQNNKIVSIDSKYIDVNGNAFHSVIYQTKEDKIETVYYISNEDLEDGYIQLESFVVKSILDSFVRTEKEKEENNLLYRAIYFRRK